MLYWIRLIVALVTVLIRITNKFRRNIWHLFKNTVNRKQWRNVTRLLNDIYWKVAKRDGEYVEDRTGICIALDGDMFYGSDNDPQFIQILMAVIVLDEDIDFLNSISIPEEWPVGIEYIVSTKRSYSYDVSYQLDMVSDSSTWIDIRAYVDFSNAEDPDADVDKCIKNLCMLKYELCEKYLRFKDPLRENPEVDREVEQILDMIQQQFDEAEFMMNNHYSFSGSPALQWLENQPDYKARLRNIKNHLSQAQKARIDAAEKRLAKVLDELVWQ